MGHIMMLQKYFKMKLNVGMQQYPHKNCSSVGMQNIATIIQYIIMSSQKNHIFWKHGVLAMVNPNVQWKHFVIKYHSKYNNNTTILFAGLHIWQLLRPTETSSDSVSSISLIAVQHFPFLHHKRLFVLTSASVNTTYINKKCTNKHTHTQRYTAQPSI